MILHTLSGNLRRALTRNSRARSLMEVRTHFEITGTEPANNSDVYPYRDGIFSTNAESGQTNNSILIYPISEGEPGGIYWITVWGWRVFGNDPASFIWIPMNLGQMVCVAGPQKGIANRLVTDKEYFAVSVNGQSSYPCASAVVPLMGVNKIQFDIACGDGAPAFGNALFAFI